MTVCIYGIVEVDRPDQSAAENFRQCGHPDKFGATASFTDSAIRPAVAAGWMGTCAVSDPFGLSRRIVIAGAGLGGTATAIRLLQFAREPVQIVLIERRPEYRNAGVAYHQGSNHWHHVFNIQAGRMSVFREDVDDFVNWANHEVDRSGWPAEWRDFTFTEPGPAPRRIYPEYLADRLAQAAREALDGVTLIEADGEVVDLTVRPPHVDVVVENLSLPDGRILAGQTELTADHVILATGLEQQHPAFADSVLDHPSFVRHPYSADGIERILGLRREATVAVVGTLLSAYDSAALLLRRGHTGKIYMISRSGLTLRPYPAEHRHRVLTLPPPRRGGDTYEGLEEFTRYLRGEWDRACAAVAREHPEESPAVVTERVMKAWEPYLPGILARLGTSRRIAGPRILRRDRRIVRRNLFQRWPDRPHGVSVQVARHSCAAGGPCRARQHRG